MITKRIGHKKCRPKAAGFFELLVLALLIGHAAAGLAGGLARGLALAAAAVLDALGKVTSIDGLNSLHDVTLSRDGILIVYYTTPGTECQYLGRIFLQIRRRGLKTVTGNRAIETRTSG